MKHFFNTEEEKEEYVKNMSVHFEIDEESQNIKHFQDEEENEESDNTIRHFID